MAFRFCSFSSGSSGNCYLVSTEKTAILVDAGISGKKIFQGLEMTETPPEKVMGVLVTHEHIDHVKSLRILTKKAQDIMVYANAGTWGCIEDCVKEERRVCFETGSAFSIGDIWVRTFAISHDAAEPVGYSFFAEGTDGEKKQISIVTDTGYVTEEIFNEIADADILILEANHEVGLLQYSRYPFHVKRRILSDFGHLSNVAAGECVCRLMKEQAKRRRVILAHLSKENNTPAMARLAIKSVLEENDLYIGEDVNLEVVTRDNVSAIYEL